jgi:hypothetical protein
LINDEPAALSCSLDDTDVPEGVQRSSRLLRPQTLIKLGVYCNSDRHPLAVAASGTADRKAVRGSRRLLG